MHTKLKQFLSNKGTSYFYDDVKRHILKRIFKMSSKIYMIKMYSTSTIMYILILVQMHAHLMRIMKNLSSGLDAII
jgi:hypothetical protein